MRRYRTLKAVERGVRGLATKRTSQKGGAPAGASKASKASPATPGTANPANKSSSGPESVAAAKPSAGSPSTSATAGQPAAGSASAGATTVPPPTGGPTGKPPTKPPSNAWLLHPKLPVDVRAVGGGLLGAALLSYYSTMSSSPPAANDDGGGSHADKAQAADHPEALRDPYALPAEHEPTASDAEAAEKRPGANAAGAHGDEGGASTATEDGKQEEQGEGGAEDEGEPVYVETDKMLGLVEEMLRGGGGIGDGGGGDGAAAAALHQQQQQAEEARGPGHAAVNAEEVLDLVGDLEREADEDLASLSSSSRLSSLSDGLPVDGSSGSTGPPPLPGGSAPPVSSTKGVLGLPEEVTASLLIARANEAGLGPDGNWQEFKHRHKQAEADALAIKQMLGQALEHQRQVVDSSRSEVASAIMHTQRVLELARRQEEEFKQALVSQSSELEQRSASQLQLQADRLAAAHERALNKERADMAGRLDEVRHQVNALRAAFILRSDERRCSHAVHQVALAGAAVKDAVSTGAPFHRHVEVLARAAPDDEVVKAVAETLPREWAAKGVPTHAQIMDSFQDVRRVAGEMALIPAGQRGVATMLLAKVAAKLKVPEPAPPASSSKGGGTAGTAGVSTVLSRAEAHLVAGELLSAAETLEGGVRGTAAEKQVAGWVNAVRARVAADQAVTLLQARASTLAASLS